MKTQVDLIETVLTKGISEIIPNKEYLKSLLVKGSILTIYSGFDPTGPTLHIGHAIQLRKLRQFQDLGHKIIFLVGDFTARIGDPDKMSTRNALTEREIKTNLRLYKKQASKIICFSGKNAATIKFNNTWLGKMKFADVVSLASNMTVDQMLKRDMFARRMTEGKPIYIHEFLYPLMQAYDSVVMNVDGEVGGNDQLFNMLAGRTLLRQMKQKEKFVVTTKLLEDPSGAKMGKTTGNMISFLDTPQEMYGKVMAWTDGMIVPGFELCTDYTMSQVESITQELQSGINPRDVKMRLAFEIVRLSTDQNKAQIAEEFFIATFQKKEIHETIQEIAGRDRSLETILIEENIITSKSEIRRLVEAHAITNFETKETLVQDGIKKPKIIGVYKIGKKVLVRIN